MLTREVAIKQVQHFLVDCQATGLNLHKAILFGSMAKKTQHEFSDIDLALVSSQFGRNFLKNNHLTSKINIRYPDIEVHHISLEQFLKEDPFVEEIKITGLEISVPKPPANDTSRR